MSEITREELLDPQAALMGQRSATLGEELGQARTDRMVRQWLELQKRPASPRLDWRGPALFVFAVWLSASAAIGAWVELGWTIRALGGR